jgi:DNA-binding response OmpR family regulator
MKKQIPMKQIHYANEYLSPKEKSSAYITYGNLSIDKEKCCAYKDGEPIELGAKEYKLLLFFLEHPEKVFTKRQLYQAVWDEEYYFDDNTIMVHISRITDVPVMGNSLEGAHIKQ